MEAVLSVSTRRPIVVVDDDEEERLVVLDRLERARIPNPIVPCRSVKEVIIRLIDSWTSGQPEQWPCLLLLDLKMPKLTGFDLLTWLNAQPDIRDLKVVVISSSANPADMDRAKALGAAGYMMKFPSAECLAAIVQTVSAARSAKPSRIEPTLHAR